MRKSKRAEEKKRRKDGGHGGSQPPSFPLKIGYYLSTLFFLAISAFLKGLFLGNDDIRCCSAF